MGDVKRYSVVVSVPNDSPFRQTGDSCTRQQRMDVVSASDYATLEAENAKLRAELERLALQRKADGRLEMNMASTFEAGKELRALLDAPRQTEGEGRPEVVAWLNTLTGETTIHEVQVYDWDDENQPVQSLMTIDQHERAIAELREECERLRKDAGAEMFLTLTGEVTSLRQQLAERDAEIEELCKESFEGLYNAVIDQRDKLAELLRDARELIDHGDFREGHCMCGSGVEGHSLGDGHAPVDAGEYYAGQVRERIDAALAEVNK